MARWDTPAPAPLRRLVDFATSPRGDGLCAALFWLAAVYAALAGGALRLWAPILLKHDNAFFMPIAFAARNGLGLDNPWVNPTGSGQFDWHGIIHPVLMTALAPSGAWSAVNAAVVLIAGAGMTLYLIMLWRLRAPAVVKAPAAIIIVAAFLGFSGRPETTAAALMGLLFALNWSAFGARRLGLARLAASGGVLGVLGAAHPIAAALTVCVYVGALALSSAEARRPAGVFAGHVALVGVLAAATMVASFVLLYPGDMIGWAHGMLAASQQAADRASGGWSAREFLTYFVATKHMPFLALSFVPLAYVLAVGARRAWRSAWFFRITAIAAGLVFAAIVVRFPIAIPPTYYNFAVLMPGLALVSAMILRNRLKTALGFSATLTFAAFAGACALAQGLWAYQTVAGRPLVAEQRVEVRTLVRSYQSRGWRVAVDTPFLATLPDVRTALGVEALFFGRRADGGKTSPSAQTLDVVIRAQAEFAAPPQLEGFTQVRNAYRDGFGATSFSRPEHLGYAVYVADRVLSPDTIESIN